MPTTSCTHAQGLISQMLNGTSDRIALVAAGIISSTPLWFEWAKQISEVGAMIGPGLAALFVISKIVLVWIQIWKAAKGERVE